MQKTGSCAGFRFLLCKSFCKQSATAAKKQDWLPFVDDAAGSMPVCIQENSI